MNASEMDSALAHSLDLSFASGKPAKNGSVAISRGGMLYPAGAVQSQTHILHIPSELAALVRAVHDNDPLIEMVHSVVVDPATPVSPLVLKILADHSARTGIAMHYTVRDTAGNILFDAANAREALPFYRAPNVVLASLGGRTPQSGKVGFDSASGVNTEMQLRKWALAGCVRNFPTRDGASGYGAAVLTKSGDIYYGGQYSAFDERLGVHAEMAVLVNALMSGARDITHLGVASSKFPHTPCSACGACRQLIAELSRTFGLSLTVLFFASENEQYSSHTIDELLPVQWSNKK